MSNLIIDLNQLRLVEANDTFGADEPYLWCFGIVIDLNDQDPSSDLRFVIRRDPKPGNIGPGPLRAGESRAIPNTLGRFQRGVAPIFGQRFGAGVLVLGWEHDSTPAESMQRAYDDSAKVLDDFIQERVQTLNDAPLSDAELDGLKADLTGAIAKRMRERFHLNPDDSIGADFFLRFSAEPNVAFRTSLALNLRGSKAHYRVLGVAEYTP